MLRTVENSQGIAYQLLEKVENISAKLEIVRHLLRVDKTNTKTLQDKEISLEVRSHTFYSIPFVFFFIALFETFVAVVVAAKRLPAAIC
jgi:hypothetical protein